MNKNAEVTNESASAENDASVATVESTNDKQPIMPDADYAAAVAEENQEELNVARKKLMTLIRVKCASLGKDTIENQLQPMVYSMNLADCKAMHDSLAKKGIIGLIAMATKHQKKSKKK